MVGTRESVGIGWFGLQGDSHGTGRPGDQLTIHQEQGLWCHGGLVPAAAGDSRIGKIECLENLVNGTPQYRQINAASRCIEAKR